jgi:hypothetical protein
METNERVDVLAVMGREVARAGGSEYPVGRELIAARAAMAELIAAMRGVMPFVATQAVGCHGDKCREQWCYSCFGEEAADEAAVRARDAYHAAHIALARITPAAQESEP